METWVYMRKNSRRCRFIIPAMVLSCRHYNRSLIFFLGLEKFFCLRRDHSDVVEDYWSLKQMELSKELLNVLAFGQNYSCFKFTKGFRKVRKITDCHIFCMAELVNFNARTNTTTIKMSVHLTQKKKSSEIPTAKFKALNEKLKQDVSQKKK